jgi:tRNA A-37 threonylcarbamoyl transferase component Bud32
MDAVQQNGGYVRQGTTANLRIAEPWLTAARIGWLAITALVILVLAISLPYYYDNILTAVQDSADTLATLHLTPAFVAGFHTVLGVAQAAIFGVVALLLFWRKPDKLGLFTAAMLVTFGMAFSNGAYHQVPPDHPLFVPGMALSGLGNGLLVIFLYVLPDGRFFPAWTRPAAVIWLIYAVVVMLPPVQTRIGSMALIGSGVSLAAYISGMVAQVQREQRSTTPTHTQQKKWVMTGLSIALMGFIIYTSQTILLTELSDISNEAHLLISMFLALVLTVTMAMVPLTIGLSILRYRLWDVDIVLNRTLVYGVLTVLLVFIFMLDLYILQLILTRVTGQEQMPIALAASALVAGILFQPTRHRLQTYMDRRFYRIIPPEKPVNRPNTVILPGSSLTTDTIGPYVIETSIGQGGMAEVYRGRHTTLDRPVAIKIMTARTADDEAFRRRFEREAQTVAALRHPNIVQVFDYGTVDNMPYMAMEYIEGTDLLTYLQTHGPLSMDDTCQIGSEIAAALDYAHAHDVVHRDVKPSNVLIQIGQDEALRAVLTDFGIAKIHTQETHLTRTGTVGTLDYMAPEQIMSSRTVDAAADVYSLGVMLFEMLTGQLPFQGDNPGAIILASLQQPAPDPRSLRPDLPPQASWALLRALDKDPSMRHKSAAALVDDLRE